MRGAIAQATRARPAQAGRPDPRASLIQTISGPASLKRRDAITPITKATTPAEIRVQTGEGAAPGIDRSSLARVWLTKAPECGDRSEQEREAFCEVDHKPRHRDGKEGGECPAHLL